MNSYQSKVDFAELKLFFTIVIHFIRCTDFIMTT